MHLPKAALFLLLLGAVVDALQAVYAPEEDRLSEDLLKEAEQRGINFNTLLDDILVSARKALVLAKEDTVPLPDFTEDFYQKIWPFVVHGHLHCTKGSLRSLASVKRTGDAKLAFKKSKLIVLAPIGLQELVVEYDYDASILHLGTTGNLFANVTSNSVTLAIEISISVAGCKLKLDEAKINDFGPIKVNLTGLYPLDTFSSVIAEKAAVSLHDTIKETAERNLQKNLQKIVEKVPCHLPGLKDM
ncbi:Mite allergen Der p 7 [Frankliniella fusca]|uniref:Mite allergen Der p 7 n=1 Tax=Frankliniella fusca TaxID=407009 RepID=A0AAE1H2J9_9NEOP|nr:Mite allergen Der p 7 [Frankliniella fusca]